MLIVDSFFDKTKLINITQFCTCNWKEKFSEKNFLVESAVSHQTRPMRYHTYFGVTPLSWTKISTLEWLLKLGNCVI